MNNLDFKIQNKMRNFGNVIKEVFNDELARDYKTLIKYYSKFITKFSEYIVIAVFIYFAVGAAMAESKGELISKFMGESLINIVNSHLLEGFLGFIKITFYLFTLSLCICLGGRIGAYIDYRNSRVRYKRQRL